MKAHLGLVVLLGVVVHGIVVTRPKTKEWTHQALLSEKNSFRVQWRNSLEEKDGTQWIIMEMSAKARGYLGVGFSSKGGMIGADIVIGWVDEQGQPHLMDFHGTDKNDMPILDTNQDFVLLSGEETEEGTTIRFKRKWDTCDDQDMKLEKDTTRLIWAFGDEDPTFDKDRGTFNNLVYHGERRRGVQSVFLADDAMSYNFPDEKEIREKNIKTWDMTMKNVKVTAVNTTYHCRIEKFTDTSKKHHLIGWKPIVDPNNVPNVHHILFYECNIPQHLVASFDDYSKNHPGGICYTKNMPPVWGKSCTAFLLVWTVGSEGEMLPTHVGAPLGQEHGGGTFFMIEMHYENPLGRTIYDNSGIRIYYTDQLRQHEGSVLLLGYRHSPFLLIPPKQEEFMVNGVCAKECLESTLPPEGINVVTTLIHAHLWGKKLRLRHFRNGTELPLIAEDGYYDFNYQQAKTLKQEIIIKPGDELLTECEYDTMNMNRVVLGGLATSQEMCQTFLFYYPKIVIGQCTSQSEFHDFMKGLGVDDVSGKILKDIGMPYDPKDSKYDPADTAKELEESGDGASYRSVFDQIYIEGPSNLKGLSVGEHLRRTDWAAKANGKKVEDFWKDGKHYQFCTKGNSERIRLKVQK